MPAQVVIIKIPIQLTLRAKTSLLANENRSVVSVWIWRAKSYFVLLSQWYVHVISTFWYKYGTFAPSIKVLQVSRIGTEGMQFISTLPPNNENISDIFLLWTDHRICNTAPCLRMLYQRFYFLWDRKIHFHGMSLRHKVRTWVWINKLHRIHFSISCLCWYG